ncbi:MAG: FtsQ-type POTRA domain-containing protein [Syntrophobacterales bacterium]|nr:MAG: FtsQ-type POTRA domain-containing protein [Syntrophobacterales bacterium]
MKKSLKSSIETKKNRLRRRSGKILRETMKALMVIGISGGLALLMVYVYNYAICAPYFKLGDTTVRGCEKVSKIEVIELAGIDASMNILAINLDKITEKVKRNPWIKNVSIGRELPNRLVIEVVEREAAALIKKDENLYIVDRDEEIFKGFGEDDCSSLPVLTGFCDKGDVNRGLLRMAFELLDYLSESATFPNIKNVSEIHGSSIYGLSVFTNNRKLLQLGFGDYEKKLERLNRILVDLARKELDEGYLNIDLTDCSRVIVQHRDFSNRKEFKGRSRTEI